MKVAFFNDQFHYEIVTVVIGGFCVMCTPAPPNYGTSCVGLLCHNCNDCNYIYNWKSVSCMT
jgi:hypothetical protein